MSLTPTQRDNLSRLARHLRTVPQWEFNMAAYRTGPAGRSLDPTSWQCGSVGCAVGHGPAAGVPVAASDQYWPLYAARVFGCSCESDWEARERWWGLFGPDWVLVDNTPHGAAERIERYLATGHLQYASGLKVMQDSTQIVETPA